MSTDTEANHHKRIAALEKQVAGLNNLSPEIEARLNWLEHPPAQAVENPEPPLPPETRGLLTCPQCGAIDIESKGCTAILWDRGIEHHCKGCDHWWRVTIKNWYKRDMEKRTAADAKAKSDARFREVGLDPVAIDAEIAANDKRYEKWSQELQAKCPDSVIGPPQVYRINYRMAAGAKPTFIHVRAESPTRALMAFIDETSTLQVSAVKLDNEYGGPLLNERENTWPGSNEPKVAQENTGGNDEDDIQTGPVVREGA